MIADDAPEERSDLIWYVGTSSDYSDDHVTQRGALADSARVANWDAVFAIAEGDPGLINAPRVDSASGFAALHQAAWHGADRSVVERLLGAGAWRTLRTTDGRRPVDIALSRGHTDLLGLLAPELGSPADPRTVDRPSDVHVDIETYLHALITVRSRHFGGEPARRRLPQVEVIEALGPDRPLLCPIPGMCGGFSFCWDGGGVTSVSGSRISWDSHQVHRVTRDGIELVEDDRSNTEPVEQAANGERRQRASGAAH